MVKIFYSWLRETASLFQRYVLITIFSVFAGTAAFVVQHGDGKFRWPTYTAILASLALCFRIWSRANIRASSLASATRCAQVVARQELSTISVARAVPALISLDENVLRVICTVAGSHDVDRPSVPTQQLYGTPALRRIDLKVSQVMVSANYDVILQHALEQERSASPASQGLRALGIAHETGYFLPCSA